MKEIKTNNSNAFTGDFVLINKNNEDIPTMSNGLIITHKSKHEKVTKKHKRKKKHMRRNTHKLKDKKRKKELNTRNKLRTMYYTYCDVSEVQSPSLNDKGSIMVCIDNENYVANNKGLTLKNNKNDSEFIFISNVVPFVVKQLYEHKEGGETISTLMLGIYEKDMSPIKISVSDLTNVGYISNHLPHGVIIKDYYRFSSFVKCMAEKANLCHLYNYIGFTEENSYVHSGGVISAEQRNNTRSELGDGSLTLRHHPVSSKKIVSCLDELFGLEPATTMMVSFTLLSLCYSQYKQDRPEFVFLLYGSSGTFKTTLSMHIFNIFEENYTSPPTNLKVATEASIHRL